MDVPLEIRFHNMDPSDAIEARVLLHRLRRAAKREDAEAVRVLACLDALQLAPARAAELAMAAHLRVRQDLAW